MNIKKISLDEAKKPIVVTIPEGRSYTVRAEESGYTEDQVFTSDDFSSQIKGNYVGLVKTKEQLYHPMYAITPTLKHLYLGGIAGYRNASAILHNVSNALLNQDEYLTVRSIKEADLAKYDYKKENITTFISGLGYWVASTGTRIRKSCKGIMSEHLVLGKVVWDNISEPIIFFNVGKQILNLPDHAPIRPVVILNSVVVEA